MELPTSKKFLKIISYLFTEQGFEFKLESNKFTKKIGTDLVSVEFKFSHSFGMITLKEVFVVATYHSIKKELLNIFEDYCDKNNIQKKLIHKRYHYFWFDEGLNFEIKTLPTGEPSLESYGQDDFTIPYEQFKNQLFPKITAFLDLYFPISNFIKTLADFAKNGITDTIVYDKGEYLIQYYLSEKNLPTTEKEKLWNQYLKDERKASIEKFPPFVKEMKNLFNSLTR